MKSMRRLAAAAFGSWLAAFAIAASGQVAFAAEPQKLPHRKAEPGQLKYEPFDLHDVRPGGADAASAQQAPSAGDLSETEDVRLTAGVQELAQALAGNPKKILRWVKRNVAFTPTFGSIQGSEGCRLARECNAHDTSSLLIALLRASNVPARYALGEVLLDPALFKSAMGDFGDLESAGLFAVASGTPTTFLVNEANEIVGVRLQHVWVEAYLTKGGIEQWVPLDAALKRNEFKAPKDIDAALSLSAEVFESLLSSASVDANGDSIANVDAPAIRQTVQELQVRLHDLIAQRPPESTVAKLTGGIKSETSAIGLKPEPGIAFEAQERLSELPAASRHQLRLTLNDLSGAQVLETRQSLPSLANKRLSIAYVPATQADLDLANSAGGLYQAPPNLLGLRPVVYVQGEPVAAGSAVPMGTLQNIRIFFEEPDGVSDFVDHFITAGTYAVVGLNLQRVGSEALQARRQHIASTVDQARAGSRINLDDVLGEILHSQTQIYYALLDAHTQISAHRRNVVYSRRPAELLMTFAPVFTFNADGVPIATRHGAMTMDFRRSIFEFRSRTGNVDDGSAFFFGTGAFSSALEHGIFEITQDTASISTMRLLTEANEQGVPIFAIDADNVERVLPQLNLPAFIEDQIAGFAAAGYLVIVHSDIVQFLLYSGAGLMVIDPGSGGGGYLIVGGIFGGFSAENSESVVNVGTGTVNRTPLEIDEASGLPVFAIPNGGASSTNATSVEGLMLRTSRENQITENDVAVLEYSLRQIGTLSLCARERLANVESGALLNEVLWNSLFGSPSGIPEPRMHAPTLSAFIFDNLVGQLRESREQALVCQ